MKYAREPSNPNKTSQARGRDLRTHFKNTYEVVSALKHMNLRCAQRYLEDVLAGKRCIPFRKFTGCIGRTAQAKEFKVTQGRWPVKSCRVVLDLLKNAESNAEVKNLDVENLHIEHIMVNRASPGRRRTYRAHGRISPYMSHHSHLEVILKEKEEAVELPEKDVKNKVIKLSRKKLARQRIRVGGGK